MCTGYVSIIDKKTIELPKRSTIEDARTAFGRAMRQQRIQDENGYEIVGTTSPIWKCSRNCKLGLEFAYDREEEIKIAATSTKKFAAQVVGNTWKTFKVLSSADHLIETFTIKR